MRSSIVVSALVAVVVGFGGSVAVIIEAANALGASKEQQSSMIGALCFSIMATSAYLSVRFRKPVVTAWSTPGAAAIAATAGVTMEIAVGAFLLAAGLMVATAFITPLANAVNRIPRSVAAAMLAGVLFTFVVAVLPALQSSALLVAPLVALFLVWRLFSAIWAVPVVLFAGVLWAIALGQVTPPGPLHVTTPTWITPVFDTAALVGVGVPLYLLTMGSQNLPGFAVLKSDGYEPPARAILASTGFVSLVAAFFGAHATNLAAITASLCTGPMTHPDKTERWKCGPVYAAAYAVLAVVGASVVTVFAGLPAALIAVIAGLALAAPFVGALGAAVSDSQHRFAAATTFVVTASNIQFLGISSAFWGLCAGLCVVLGDHLVTKDAA